MVVCDPALYLERYIKFKKVNSEDSTHIQKKSIALHFGRKIHKKQQLVTL